MELTYLDTQSLWQLAAFAPVVLAFIVYRLGRRFPFIGK